MRRLLKPGGYFFMTSQCHDEHELLQFFSQSGVSLTNTEMVEMLFRNPSHSPTVSQDGVWEGCKFILVQNLTHNFVDLRLMIFQKPV